MSAFRGEEKVGGWMGRESTTSRGESFFWTVPSSLQFFLLYVHKPTHLSIYTYIGRDQDPRAGAILSGNPQTSGLPQCQKTLVTAAKRGTRFDGNVTGAGRCVPNDNDAAKF